MDLNIDDELVQEYLAESREHLATIETDLLTIEHLGANINEQLVNRVFRAAHSIKGGAGFFDLLTIQELAHKTENVLDLVRSRELAPTSEMVNVLLLAFDKLSALIQNHRESNGEDIAGFVTALTKLAAGQSAGGEKSTEDKSAGIRPVGTAEPAIEELAGKATSAVTDAPEKPAPAPATQPSAPAPRNSSSAAPNAGETTIRLNVALLDSLMTLAGELVLSRNQLNEALAHQEDQGIRAAAHRIALVTSELQEAVSLTRMQPVGSLFAKFPRLVRDLAGELGKEVQLEMEGGDVEIDKTILEGLSDPLTHMVRNSVDHGIEPADARASLNKPRLGTVALRARHQAGQVIIEISDDGKGLSAEKIAASSLAKGLTTAEQLQTMSDSDKRALIFLPGVSTAEKVSNVSGRGVGMDVVKTNLDRLGGKIEILSTVGKGSSFLIKLPLTLAIIPSLLVSSAGERFAIPQVSVGELIRIPADQISSRLNRAGDAEIVLVRDRMVPLVHLADALGTGRPERGSKALNIVLVDTGSFQYGLVVEELHDTVEIVVKPMGRHLKGIRDYAGATILGDGQVAVILDVAGLAARANLSGSNGNSAATPVANESGGGEAQALLLFHNAPGEPCAVPIELVTRIEHVRSSQVQYLGGRRTMQYGGASLPLVALRDVAAVGDLTDDQQWVVIVFERAGSPIGLLAAEPLDMMETVLRLDSETLRQPGVAGSAIVDGQATLMLDLFELAETVRRRGPERETSDSGQPVAGDSRGTVLVAEDSDFFRGQIKRLIEAVGYQVMAAPDGEAAWELLNAHADKISVVTTDVEMPRLDGFALTQRIRGDSRFTELPIIALSTLAAEEEVARGLEIGVTEYQVKFDRDQLLGSIRRAMGSRN